MVDWWRWEHCHLKERPEEEQKTYEQRIALACEQFRLNGGAVAELLKIA